MNIVSDYCFPGTRMLKRTRWSLLCYNNWGYHFELFFCLRNEIIFSPIKRSSVVEVFIGGQYLLIIAHAIERYCSRYGIEEFGIVFAKNLNCLIRALTASTTHRTFVTHLDALASDVVNCRRPCKNGGSTTFKPRLSIVSTASLKPLSTTTMSS